MISDFWISDKIVLDKMGFMRVDKRISFDKIFQRKIEIPEKTLEFIKKAREKILNENVYIKNLVESF